MDVSALSTRESREIGMLVLVRGETYSTRETRATIDTVPAVPTPID